MSKAIQRWGGSWDGGCGKSDDGEYVLYTDHMKAVAGTNALAWQPIETAPRDVWVLVTWRGGVFVAKRTRQGWEDSRKGLYGAQPPEPTHWQPLPAAPESTR